MTALLRLLILPQEVRKTDLAADVDADEVVVHDLEAVGYQASFSKLGASEAAREDPVREAGDPQQLLVAGLGAAGRAAPGVVRDLIATAEGVTHAPASQYQQLLGQVPPELAGPLQDLMRTRGVVLS